MTEGEEVWPPECPGSAEPPPLIRASELSQYSFCHRAWWLATVKKLPSGNQAVLAQGRQFHDRHGRQVRAVWRWRRLGFILLGSSFLLMAALFWFWIF